jgi:hypothetical protein
MRCCRVRVGVRGSAAACCRAMKKPLATFGSLLVLSLAAACGGGSSAAVGTYQLDRAALKKDAMAAIPAEQKKQMEALPAEQRKMAEDMMNKQFDAMDVAIELKDGGTATVTTKGMGGKDETESGTWKLEGDKLTLATKDAGGKEEMKTATMTSGAFSFTEEQGGMKMTMTFKKK